MHNSAGSCTHHNSNMHVVQTNSNRVISVSDLEMLVDQGEQLIALGNGDDENILAG